MSKKSIVLVIILFALIVVGMFVYANLKQAELAAEPTPNPVDTVVDVPYPEVDRITATHYFIDGEHTLVGEVNMPTPCDLLEAETLVMESYPEQVLVAFTVINSTDSCTQVITPQRFKIEAVASEEASFSATFMGRSVELNLIPAAAGETPDDFEVFIKG